MTTNPTPDLCPNCQHPQHTPGTECETQVSHGPNRWHLCLCLARPGAALPCPPQMTCQGGTLGYADIWYLQQGHTLMSTEGEISPEVLKTGPVSVGFPSDPAASAVVAVAVPPTGQTALRDRIAEALYANDHLGHLVPLNETGMGPAYRESADAVLAVLPPPAENESLWDELHRRDNETDQPHAPAPADRAAVLAEAIAALEQVRDTKDVNVAVYPRYDQHQQRALDAGISALRRLADEAQQQPETRPARGDQFEQWLKAQRDAAADHPEAYQAADGLLDLYRLHADMGVPLDGHVCEGRVVGDCECLEPLAHSCGNCDGIDPNSCLMNPDRPAAPRPRCPRCRLPHDLTPGSMPVRACESILASLAEAARLHDEGDHSRCAVVDCGVVRARRDAASAGVQTDEETSRCSVPNACDPDDGPCERHEREQSHAEGDHSVCRRDECAVLRQS